MVILLNYIIPIILLTMVVGGLYLKNKWLMVSGIVLTFVVMAIQPSYLPKGEIVRSTPPPFEQSEGEIENKLLSPKSGEEYDKKREESVKEGLPFIK